MSPWRNYTPKDYLALGLSLLLAFGVWFIHNLSLNYSDLVKSSFVAKCDLPGHSDMSAGASEVTARCKMSGLDIVYYKNISGKSRPSVIIVSQDNLKHYDGDVYYMTKDDLARYFHDIFGDNATLEYFVTDTVFFSFPFEDYKKVPVRAVSSISFKQQYMPTSQLRLSPDSVFVYGRRELLDDVVCVNTELIDASNVSSSVIGEADLEKIRDIRISDVRVRYELQVSRYVEQEFSVGVICVNVPAGVSAQVFPQSAMLKIKTVFPGVDDLPGASVSVDFNDFEGSRNGKCLGTVTGLPADVIAYTLEPEIFDCVISKE